MPFDWSEFLTLAEQLSQNPAANEASLRTAISRTYYSIFNVAYARAMTTAGPFPGNQGMHQWCWVKYTSTGDQACRQLGLTGERLKQRRIRVDYQSGDIQQLPTLVQRSIMEAHQFHRDFAALNPRYPLP
jgi:hypothetical protein